MCVNATLEEGAMFAYVDRFEQLGFDVVIADPNISEERAEAVKGSECPHVHLRSLWNALARGRQAPVVIVAHSYGASAVTYLLKTERVLWPSL